MFGFGAVCKRLVVKRRRRRQAEAIARVAAASEGVSRNRQRPSLLLLPVASRHICGFVCVSS